MFYFNIYLSCKYPLNYSVSHHWYRWE